MGTFEILGSDPYPIGSGNKTTSGVHQEVNLTVFQTDDARPVWEVIQAMNWANYHKGAPCPRCHTPTYTETRSMTWQSIAAGANGIVFYEYTDLLRNPDVPFETSFANLKEIAAEVMLQAPIILSDAGKAPSPAVVGHLSSPRGSWLMTRAQWSDDRERIYVLFAVSDGDGQGPVTFDLSNRSAFGCISELSVLRVIEPDPRAGKKAAPPVVIGCTFTDTVPLMAAVAYNISFKSDDDEASKRQIYSTTIFHDVEHSLWPYFRSPALLNVGGGVVLAFAHAAQSATDTGHGNSVIVMRRSSDGGRSFESIGGRGDGVHILTNSTPHASVFENPQPVWDSQRKRVILAFTALEGSTHGPQIVQLISDDHGQTFPGPLQLVSEKWFSEKFFAAQSSGGTAIQLAGGAHRGRVIFSGYLRWETVWWSDDGGSTYNQTLLPNGASEMAVAELTDATGQRNGSVIAMIHLKGRHAECACKGFSVSHDSGQTFSKIAFIHGLVSPGAQAALLSLPSGRLLFGGPGSEYLQARLTLRLHSGSDRINQGWSHADMLSATDGGYVSLANRDHSAASKQGADDVLVLFLTQGPAVKEGGFRNSSIMLRAVSSVLPECIALGKPCPASGTGSATCCSGVRGNVSTCVKEVAPPVPPPPPRFVGDGPFDVFFPGLQPQLQAAGMESCYRIPSLLYVPSRVDDADDDAGALLAVLESKHGHVCGDGVNSTLVMRRSTDLGTSWGAPFFPYLKYENLRKWGQPQMTFDAVTHTTFLQFSNETISSSPGGKQTMTSILQIRSTDGGVSWTPPDQAQRVDDADAGFPLGAAPTSGNGIQLRPGHPLEGRLIWAMDTSSYGTDELLLSDNHGSSYNRSYALTKDPSSKINELQTVQLGNGSVLVVMRNIQEGKRQAVAVSDDGGETFGPIRLHPDLLTPVCQGSVLFVKGNTILYAGPRSTSSRVDMTVLASDDDGNTFNRSMLVWHKKSMYSSMQLLPSGEVILLFERDGGNTSVVRFSVSSLKTDDATAVVAGAVPADYAPGFVGVYHSATGNVADDRNSTAWSVGQFGAVAFENSPGDGGLNFRQNMEANCKQLGANAVYGMLIAHSEGGIFSNPNDSSLWEPLNLTERGKSPSKGGPTGMLQGAARWSTLAQTFCPQIDGVVIDDFWSNYHDGGGGPPVPNPPPGPPGKCGKCPADKPHMYGSAGAGFYCCTWPVSGGHCTKPKGGHAGGGCCVFSGSVEHCQHDKRCGTNPKNWDPCEYPKPPLPGPPPTPPTQGLTFEHMQDIKATLQGKVLHPNGTVHHSSPALTPHLKLFVVMYDHQIASLGSPLVTKGVVDGASFWISGPSQRHIASELTALVAKARAVTDKTNPNFPIFTGGYVTCAWYFSGLTYHCYHY